MFVGNSPIHIEKDADIAGFVLMPGDPLRAKYIADNFLSDAVLVTNIRNMSGYTGTYKGVKVTVMAHGMGMPSASIYVFELIHFFHVKKIIRIGTCGAVSNIANVGDIILSESIYSESNFAYTYNDYIGNVVETTKSLNNIIKETAKELELGLHAGMTTTMDVYGPYIDYDRVIARIPEEYNVLGEEMEAFGVSHVANTMGIEATTLMTVADSKFSKTVLTPEERQTKLNDMIKLGLESIIK